MIDSETMRQIESDRRWKAFYSVMAYLVTPLAIVAAIVVLSSIGVC